MASHDLSSFPHAPGVYLFKDKKGKVIYVGKSVNLRSRVGSYFQGNDLGAAKNRMVKLVAAADWVEVRNETEALVLETNLIKRHAPKFNVLMKDDKNLSYVAVTDGEVPEMLRTRQRGMPGAKYFGPYSQFVDVTTVLRTVRRAFHVRSCRMKFGHDEKGKLRVVAKAGRSIPCMDHYIGLCPAPCTLEPEKITLHLENVRRAKDFFAGKAPQVAAELETKMKALAAERRFEEAATAKREWEQVKLLADRQVVRDAVSGDHDAVVFLSKYGRTFAGVAEVRDGSLVGMWRWELTSPLGESEAELAEGFLARRYAVSGVIPSQCHPEQAKRVEGSRVNKECSDTAGSFDSPVLRAARSEGLAQDDTAAHDHKVALLLPPALDLGPAVRGLLEGRGIATEVPSIGPKADLLAFAKNDLLNWAMRQEMASIGKKNLTRTAAASLLAKLGLPVPGKGEIVLECYDISHLQGQYTVASRSVVANGKADPKRYRKYKVRSMAPGQIDDFASLREVLSRRTKEGLEQNNFPTLFVIDGGKGQLSSALGAMEAAFGAWKMEPRPAVEPTRSSASAAVRNATDGIPKSLSSAKRKKPDDLASEPSAGPYEVPALPPMVSLAKREEEVFLPGKSDPVLLEKGSPELMILQKARDEAHRFAISFNRKSRDKGLVKNMLDEIPGIGPSTRRALLKAAGSIDGIKDLPEADLAKLATAPQREALRDHGLL